jgi:hypothetical protein
VGPDGEADPAHGSTVGDDPSGEAPPSGEARGASDDASQSGTFDLKALLRQLTTPMVESLDARLRDQVEAHVDELLAQKVDAAIRDRLSTLDRAIADLSRSLEALERRIEQPPLDEP